MHRNALLQDALRLISILQSLIACPDNIPAQIMKFKNFKKEFFPCLKN